MAVQSVPRAEKQKKPRPTLSQQWALVTGADAHKRWPAGVREEIKYRLKRERKNLTRDVPSQPWFDAKWERAEQFPPGGDVTLMERCACCDHYTPPVALTARSVCLDCVYESMSPWMLEKLPSSNSGIDLRRLKASRRKHGPDYAGGL